MELTTNDSFVQADLLHKNLSIHRRFVPHYSNQDAPRYRQEGFIEQIFVPNAEPLQLELLDFVQSVQNKAQPKVSGEDGIAALGLALEIRDKIETRCDEKPLSREASEVWRKLETPVAVAN
jgi:predicted dehydrogenase